MGIRSIQRQGAVATAVCACLTVGAAAQVTMPNEGEGGETLNPLFSYFGGVSAFGARPATGTIHSGDAIEVWADFQHDPFFNVAGFALGTLDVGAPDLNVEPGADTFSITIEAPANGTLSFFLTYREDDNLDGVVDPADDDEWETTTVMIDPGVNVYNIPGSAFEDVNPGDGNDTLNLDTSPRIGYFITFESRPSYAGGMIETPVAFRVDHVGFYAGAQSIPAGNPCAPDQDASGDVGILDLLTFLSDWFAGAVDCDGSGQTDVLDLLTYLAGWFAA